MAAPVVAGDVITIGRTRAFFATLEQALHADVAQVELALSTLAGMDLDEQTLSNFQTVQDDAARAAARCRSTIAVLDDRHRQLEEAVNATPDAARTDFYLEGPMSSPPGAAAQPAAAPNPADKLKIAGRVQLDEGETLVASGKYSARDGNVRWVQVRRPDGSPAVRLGIGDGTFASRNDESGPWTAGPDPSIAINAQRSVLRDELGRLEDRFGEIETAEKVAALRASNPAATLTDLMAERDRVRARLDEIREHDQAVNAARARELDGEPVDPAELNPPPYCEPGEYDRLRNRWNQLRDLPGQEVWSSPPRPAEPGEVDALNQRYDELEDTDLSEVYPSGFTARLDLPAIEQARQDIAAAVERAETTCQAGLDWWDEHERLEAANDQQALAAHKVTEPDMEYEVFAEGRVAGEWGDLAYRVDLDEYDSGVDVRIGIVPHGSPNFTDLDDVIGYDAGSRLTTAEARKFVAALGRVTGAAAN